MTPWILDQAAAATSEHVGGKARAPRVAAAGLPVPRFLVVSAAACMDSRSGTTSSSSVRRVAMMRRWQRSVPRVYPIAVRSSAAEEDGVRHSFAGQLDSFLDVPCHDVRARIVDVWRSAFGDRARVYRRERGLTGQVCPPAVILQRMIAPRASGVAFSADPVSGRRSVAVVSAVRGAGSALVSGEADAETWHVTREGAIVAVAKSAGESVLSDEEIRNVRRSRGPRLGSSNIRRTSSGRLATASCCFNRDRSHRLRHAPIPTAVLRSGTTATSWKATAASRRR